MSVYLELDENDRTFLLNILTQRLESLREEIVHTDTRAFKEGLRQEEAGLQKLIDKVNGGKGVAAAG